MSSPPPDTTQSLARALLVVMVPAVPGFGLVSWTVDPDLPVWMPWRLLFSLGAMVLLVGERRSTWVRERLRGLGLVLAVGIYLLFGVRAVGLDLRPETVVALMLVQATTTSALVSVREVMAYLVLVWATIAGAYSVVAEPELPVALPIALSTTLVAGIGLVSIARVKAEQALRQAHQHLEDRVAERTEALSREVEVRREAERAARSADRAKSRFLAHMSHELRTPLNAVTGYTEMVREELVDEGQEELADDLQRVLDGAGHLTTMIDDLLDLARIEAGEMAVKAEVVRVDEVVDELARLLQPARAAAGVQLEVHVPPLQLTTDPARLSRVLLQLLDNAFRFAPGGRVVVRGTVGDDGDLLLEVHDDGVGIAGDQLERIFDRFTQVDDTFTRTAGGAGMGLALARDLVRHMGGEVGVRSTFGEGSTFWVRVPGPCEAPAGVRGSVLTFGRRASAS
jgi:signal transduction histidine kinase